jgi:DNA-3-methyladenine glycosylase
VLEVARALLGHELVFASPAGTIGGTIVEVEAYAGAQDPASHAFRGETARNRVMFGPAGHAYVYFTYGMHHCVNVVTGREGEASAVLVRALEPRTNLALWRARRPEGKLERAAAGPGLVCRALGLTREHNGLDLTGSALVVRRVRRPKGVVIAGPRVGIRHAPERPWRFWLARSPAVSRARGSVSGPWPGGGLDG